MFLSGNVSLIQSATIINAKTNSLILIKDTQFSGNQIQSISTAQSAKNVIIENCTIMNNIVSGNGGVVQSTTTDVVIANSTMQKNKVNGNGGIMYSKNGNVVIYNCIFLENSVNGIGGVAFMSGDGNSKLQIVKSLFHTNTAKMDGAVLYITGSVDIVVDSCNFTGNVAQSDSGLMLFDIPSLRTSKCIFSIPENRKSSVVSIYFERSSKHAKDTNYLTFESVFKYGNKTLRSDSAKADNFVNRAKAFGAIMVHDDVHGKYQIKHEETIYASGE